MNDTELKILNAAQLWANNQISHMNSTQVRSLALQLLTEKRMAELNKKAERLGWSDKNENILGTDANGSPVPESYKEGE